MAETGTQHEEVSESFSFEGFRGCTNSNPNLCACRYPGIFCPVCGEDIKDGQQAVTVTTWWDDDPTGEDTDIRLVHASCWKDYDRG